MLHRLHLRDRQRRIDRRDDLARRRHDRRRIVGAGADDDGHRLKRRLLDRAVELERHFAGQSDRPHVAEDADHFVGVLRIARLPEPLADRLLARPELLGHRVVDEDRARIGAVARVAQSPLHQPHAHRLQIVAVDPAVLDQRRLVRSPRRAAIDRELAVPAEVEHRQMTGHADAVDARRVRQARVQLTIERDRLLGRLVARTRRRDVERDDAIGADAGIAVLEEDEILHEQPGTDEQRKRQRDLRDDQTIAEAPPATARRPRVPFAHRRRELGHPQHRERPDAAEETDGN